MHDEVTEETGAHTEARTHAMKRGNWESFKEEYKKEGKLCAGHRGSRRDGRESLCRTLARIATVSRWMTTFGGYRRDTEMATSEKGALQPVVSVLWRPVRVESA